MWTHVQKDLQFPYSPLQPQTYCELGLRLVALDSSHSINMWMEHIFLHEFPGASVWVFFPLAVCIGAYPSYRWATQYVATKKINMPIPVAARSKEPVRGRWLDWIAGSNLLCVVCCQVDVSASGWSLVRRSPTECGVSECDREALIMRRPWPNGGHEVGEKKKEKDERTVD